MTMTVNGPGGITVNFPDGTDADTIDKVMRQAAGGGGAPAEPAGPSPYQRDTGEADPFRTANPLSILEAVQQRAIPDESRYRERFLGPATIGEEGEVYYKDKEGNLQPTDTSKHVVLNNKVYGRIPAEEGGTEKLFGGALELPRLPEGGLTGIARALAPGLATGPVSRAPGLTLEAAQELAPAARQGVGMRNVSGLGALEAETAGAIRPPGPPPIDSREGLLAASERLGVDIPNFVASDRILPRAGGVALGHMPIIGEPIVQSSEKLTEGLAGAVKRVAGEQGGLTPEGAGGVGKTALTNWLESSKEPVNAAYDEVAKAIDPNVRQIPRNAQKMSNTIQAEWENAAQIGESPAVREVAKATAEQVDPFFEALKGSVGEDTARRLMESGRVQRPPGLEAPQSAGLNYAGVKRLRTHIGKMIDSASEEHVPDLKRMYGALSDDLDAIVKQAGNTTASALHERANLLAKQTTEQADRVKEIVGLKSDASPAQVFDRIAAAAKGNTRADTDLLTRTRQLIGKDWGQVVSGVTGNLGLDAAGNFQPMKFARDYNALSDVGKSTLFTPAHRQALDDAAGISQRWGKVQKYQNWSGTARTGAWGGIFYGAIMHPMAMMAKVLDPTTAIGLAAGRYTATKLAAPATVQEVLSQPASAASAARWMRTYDYAARSQTPAAMSQLMLQTRNLLNNVQSRERKP
jgi:hypothetical protein